MATLSSFRPSLVLAPTPKPPNPLLPRTHHHYGFSQPKPFLRGSLAVARLGFGPGLIPEPEDAGAVLKELYDRAESLLYTVADAAVSASSSTESVSTTKQSSDWLSGITNYLETVLKFLKDGLSAVHVPYSYGFAIILLTLLVKAATFPLTKKQVESAMAMRSLQPQVKAVQERYAGDQERIQLETARLYKLAGINPLAGCLPTLATIPVWIGLYRALSNVADEGLLTEGFSWIPSLAGPTTVAARQNGSGISWLFPFVDGHPPLGWSDTLAYLALPVLLVVSQYISVQIMQSSQSNDPNMKSSQVITKFLPLMIGYFALSVPSGLSLYWFTNNILTTAQQVWLQKFGGANKSISQLSDNFVKEDEPQIQKSVSELKLTQKDTRQEEKLTPEGLRPGERFKMIKEQEARRKQQREEEKRKVEEAAAKGAQITNERHEGEARLFDNENGASVELVVEKSEERHSQTTTHSSSDVGVSVNGDRSIQDLKEDHNTVSVLKMENSEVSANLEVERRDEQKSDESQGDGKESIEVRTSTTTVDTKVSGEGTHQVRGE
ncbi:ALBINO3-like protein 1 chloroplastic [Prunus yedoensis var. nudiflora]|uniref:ALBINO3-like protein 1 chloroplastic n=1 Tax=Prunus yedoensis var. nudiflora TaxID=2094558 RepID=A0A314YHF9_PRUYE|nr:ALBINO3-like protein 1 chloroplastic [Prunus yedoensis var. nudiflora]